MTPFREPQTVLLVDDVEQVATFYVALGFEEAFRTPATGAPIHVDVVLDGYRLGIASRSSTRDDHGITTSGTSAAVVLWTDDIREGVALALRHGATLTQEPYPWLDRLEIAWVTDPAGNPVQLVQER